MTFLASLALLAHMLGGVGVLMSPTNGQASVPGGGFAIITEGGSPLTTESSSVLVTEAAP